MFVNILEQSRRKIMRYNKFHKKSILTAAAASMLFVGCGYLDDLIPPDHEPKSSSSNFGISSSTYHPYNPFETWYGYEGYPQIQTGFGNDTETYGYWYEYADDLDGGRSKILWPTYKGNEYSEDAMDPIIELCNGVCGTYSLNKGSLTYNPFVGLGFHLVGEKNIFDGTPDVADASSMGGVCVSYASEMAVSLEMGLSEEAEAEIGYAVPAVTLPKSATGITKYIAWSDFKQPSWYKGATKMPGEAAAKQLASLRFKFQGTSGTLGRFNIAAVGPYDGCGAAKFPIYLPTTTQPDPVDPDPIIPDPINPPSTTNSFETWFGTNSEYQIQTGYDNGTTTSGYWFSYGDDVDGGASVVVWPVERGNEYSDDALDPVIDYCGGLCGTAVLSKGTMTFNPYVGVGFGLAGESDYGDLEPADAAGMGGVCISYTSDIAPALEMSLGEEMDAAIGYALPMATLPKSTVGTTKFIKWADFKQPSWYKGATKITGEQASRMLTSLKFKMQGTPGSYKFNIQAVGPYNGGTCSNNFTALPNNKKKRH